MTKKTLTRRTFANLSLGLLASAALTACGGGSSDSDSSSGVNLREAFDRIQYRMTKDEVRAIVGRHEDDEANYKWEEGNQVLRVFGGDSAIRVIWEGPETTLNRQLNLGE